MLKSFKQLVGGDVTFTVDAWGGVENVKPSESMTKAARSPLYAGVPEVLASSPFPLPKDSPKKGDSWTHKAETTTSAGKMTIETKYTCEGPAERAGRKVEKISIKQTGGPDPKAPEAAKAEFKGGEGTAYFDRAAGRFLEVSTTQKAESEQKLGGKTITKKFTITTTTKPAEQEKEKPK